jgi:hypothetical protein
VAALAPVEEVEIHVHGSAVAAQADRERTLHLIGVEGLASFLAGGADGLLARIGRDPDLWLDAGDRDARGADLGGGHDAELRDPMGVRLVPRALVDRLGLRHDAVGPDLADLGDLGAHHDQVVELEVLVLLQHHAELAGRGVLRPQDAPDAVVGHDALRSLTASRSAR